MVQQHWSSLSEETTMRKHNIRSDAFEVPAETSPSD